MSVLDHRIDFVAFVSVANANPNGDPLSGNMPRQDRDGHGEMSAESIKRKIRNRLQDAGLEIYMKSADRTDDGFSSVQARIQGTIPANKDDAVYRRSICEKYADARMFGGVFAWGKKANESGTSIGICGPVTIWNGKSVDPVFIESMQITKSANGMESEGRGSDTMGMRHFVEYGLYRIQGSVSAHLAAATGFSDEDAVALKEALRTLFVGDASAARPAGAMSVAKLFWFEHGSKLGQYSEARVFASVEATLKNPGSVPRSVDDYEITLQDLPGLRVEDVECW